MKNATEYVDCDCLFVESMNRKRTNWTKALTIDTNLFIYFSCFLSVDKKSTSSINILDVYLRISLNSTMSICNLLFDVFLHWIQIIAKSRQWDTWLCTSEHLPNPNWCYKSHRSVTLWHTSVWVNLSIPQNCFIVTVWIWIDSPYFSLWSLWWHLQFLGWRPALHPSIV